MKLLEEIKQIKTGEKELRTFGWLVGGIFAGIGFVMIMKGRVHGQFFLGIGAPLIIAGLLVPKLLKNIYVYWMGLGIVLGAIVAPVVLALLYFLGITPIGLIGRMSGNKFLDLAFKKPDDSYWISKPKKDPQKSCETQF